MCFSPEAFGDGLPQVWVFSIRVALRRPWAGLWSPYRSDLEHAPCPPVERAFEFPAGKQLLADARLDFRNCRFSQGIFDVRAKIVKAKRMPGRKFASRFSDEMAGLEGARFRERRPQQEVDVEQQKSVALVHSLEAAASFAAYRATGARRYDPGRAHEVVGPAYEFPVAAKQSADNCIVEAGLAESVLEAFRRCQLTLQWAVRRIHSSLVIPRITGHLLPIRRSPVSKYPSSAIRPPYSAAGEGSLRPGIP